MCRRNIFIKNISIVYYPALYNIMKESLNCIYICTAQELHKSCSGNILGCTVHNGFDCSISNIGIKVNLAVS